MVGVVECLLDGFTAADGAVVPEHHDFVVDAQILGDPIPFATLHYQTLVRVVRDVTHQTRLLT